MVMAVVAAQVHLKDIIVDSRFAGDGGNYGRYVTGCSSRRGDRPGCGNKGGGMVAGLEDITVTMKEKIWQW